MGLVAKRDDDADHIDHVVHVDYVDVDIEVGSGTCCCFDVVVCFYLFVHQLLIMWRWGVGLVAKCGTRW